jgi:hypothetical protein
MLQSEWIVSVIKLTTKITLLILICTFLTGSGFAQDDEWLFGIGGQAGISMTMTGEAGTGFRISCGWEQYLGDTRQLRLSMGLSAWRAGRTEEDLFVQRTTDWRIFQLSTDLIFLFGDEEFRIFAGLGSSLFTVLEDVVEEDEQDYFGLDDAYSSSFLSAGIYPTVGVIRGMSASLDLVIEARFDWVLHPPAASRFTLMGGLYYFLNAGN